MALRRPLVVLLALTFWGMVIGACLVFVVPRMELLRGMGHREVLLSRWTFAAVGALFGYYAAMAGAWLLVLRSLGGAIPLGLGLRAYVLSLLPRYMPGKIASQGVRAALATRYGVPLGVVTPSLVLELACSLGSAVLIGLAGALVGPARPEWGTLRWVLVLAGVGGGVLWVLQRAGWLSSRWRELTGLAHLRRRPLAVAGFLLLYAVLWLLFGVAHWLLANALVPLPLGYVGSLTAALAVSFMMGFLSVFAPAGIGVREGVLFLFVRGWMGASNAVLFVALSRLLMIGLEVLLTLAWLAYGALRSRAAEGTLPVAGAR